MALNTKISTNARNTMVDALTALLNGGYFRIYDGTQPAGPDTAITTQTLLAELTLSSTAFAASSSGTAAANAITQDSSANATGTATWFRAVKSDGTTAVIDGSVGTSGCNLNLNSVAIQSGAAVSVTSWTLTEPASGS